MYFNTYYVVGFSVFALIAYMISVDPNVGKLISMLPGFFLVQTQRVKMMCLLYPRLKYDEIMIKFRRKKALKNKLNSESHEPKWLLPVA